MENNRRIALLWNIRSGWEAGEEQAKQVRQILCEVDPQLRFERLAEGTDIRRVSHGLIDSGSNLLVAAGGDGTVNAVASAVTNQEAALAVIPAGTLNHFARDLGIALEPVEAARQLRNGHEVAIDVGVVNNRVFINNSVLGLYPNYRSAREKIESYGFGRNKLGRALAMIGAVLRVFWRLPHLRLRIMTDEGVRTRLSPFVLIANNEHELEKGRIGQRRALDQGYLWVYVMRRCSRWAMVRYLFQLLTGKFSRKDAFEEFRVRELRMVTNRKRVRVGIDGEIVSMASPLEYRLLGRALKVIAPANTSVS